MDWIKQNKFLTGFIVFLVVVGGALGFLAFSAKDKYDTAYQAYTEKAQELNGLQTKPVYPDEANVKKMQELQKAHQAAIDSLQADLAKAQTPLKPLTPEKFQDNLRESVRRVTALAAERHVELPKDKFYMGFEAYQGVPPKPEITPQLGRMLEAMEKAVTVLFQNSVSELKDIKRELFVEEGGKASDSSPSKDGKKDKDKDKGKNLVTRQSFEIEFVALEPGVHSFVNALVSNREQFFVPKSMVIANQSDKGPSKSEQNPPPGGDNKPPASGPTKYVVGEERLNVVARIDVVNFAEPSAK